MAKKKEWDNNYTPLKNPELLEGKKDIRTLEQRIADGKRPEVKKDNEQFVESIRRSVKKEIEPFRDRLQRLRNNSTDKLKVEPEKDKE